MRPPVLEVITRHLVTRPEALRRCQASLASLLSEQTCIQTLLVDDVGQGTEWANLQMRDVEPKGEWIWVVDDDNRSFAQPALLMLLERLPPNADLLVGCADHGPHGLLPPADPTWGIGLPVEGLIGSFNVLVRATLWRAARHAWTGRYAGDYDFIREAWAQARSIVWVTSVLAGIQRISHGSREDVV